MKKLSFSVAMTSALCLGAFADHHEATQAQGQRLDQQQRTEQSVFTPAGLSDQELNQTVTDINKASTFMGMAVKNPQNENLGKVQDLVFDPKEGKIAYVVLSTGGFLGIADKAVAVPLKSLQAKEGSDHLVLNMSKDQLSAAPGLARNNWPGLNTFGTGAAAGSESGTETQQENVSTPAEPVSPPSKPKNLSIQEEPSAPQGASEQPAKVGSNSDALVSTGAPAGTEQGGDEATQPQPIETPEPPKSDEK